jgi:hypothetical protein
MRQSEPWRVSVASDGATVRILDKSDSSPITPLGTEVLTTTQSGQMPEVRYWLTHHQIHMDLVNYMTPRETLPWQLWELNAPGGKSRGAAVGEGDGPDELHRDINLAPKTPLGVLRLPAAAGDCLWLGCLLETRFKVNPINRGMSPNLGEATHVLIYRPAPFAEKNWADHDCWIGPFLAPGNGTQKFVGSGSSVRAVPPGANDLIFGLLSDGRGRLWVTTNSGVYRVEPAAVTQAGLLHGISTADWKRRYDEHLAQAPLAIRVRQLVADGKDKEALALADARLAALGRLDEKSPAEQRMEWSVVQCLRAEVQAAQPETRRQAELTYRQIIMTKWSDLVARNMAAMRSMDGR